MSDKRKPLKKKKATVKATEGEIAAKHASPASTGTKSGVSARETRIS
jgi:hypothetical protein